MTTREIWRRTEMSRRWLRARITKPRFTFVDLLAIFFIQAWLRGLGLA